MSVPEKARWKNWAEGLRQEMMTGLKTEVTKSVDAISSETATTRAEKTLRSVRFWRALQSGNSPNDVLAAAGFEIEFQEADDRTVSEVTLKLNETWMTILQGVLDRKKA